MDPATLVSTRLALHSLAEHLLAGDLWRRIGRIGLRRTPGGFGQPETLDDGAHDEPYLYVGPWAPVAGPGWNEPWGMSLPASAVTGWTDAVDFFETGLRAAAGSAGS